MDTTHPTDRPAATDAPLEAGVDLAVRARRLSLHAGRGHIYGPVDLTIPAHSLTLVTGTAGSGRTSLLLTIAGRMKPDRTGELVVLGHRLPAEARAVQLRSAAVGIHGLDDLDEEVTVAATVRERLAWVSPWYRRVRTPDDARIAELCRPVFGDREVPAGRTLVHDLHETDNLLLRLALAMLGAPDLIVLDDVDSLHDTEGRRQVWEALHGLTDAGVTVVVSATSPGELSRLGWAVLPQHVALPAH